MRTVRSAVAAMKLGALDYLTKPFDEEELLATIRRALDRHARRPLAHAHDSQHDNDAPQSQPHRILLVGGDLGWRAVLAVALQRLGRVEAAETLAAGLDRALRLLPTCVVLRGDHSLLAAGRFLRAVHARQPACISFVVGSDVTQVAFPDGEMPNIRGILGPSSDLGEVVNRIAGVFVASRGSAVCQRRFSRVIIRTLDYLSQHYSERLTVEQMAKCAGTSSSHLAHLFVAQLGLTVKEYLARVRIVIAQELLAQTDQKMAHIATSVGFFDTSHLARAFQRLTGSPPSAYRQSAGLRRE